MGVSVPGRSRPSTMHWEESKFVYYKRRCVHTCRKGCGGTFRKGCGGLERGCGLISKRCYVTASFLLATILMNFENTSIIIIIVDNYSYIYLIY